MLIAEIFSPYLSSNPVLMAILTGAIVLLVSLTLLFLLFRFLRTNRELLHAERMKSLENGLSFEAHDETKARSKYVHNAFWIAFWMGFGLPAAGFSAAYAVTSTYQAGTALSIVAWIGAAVAAMGGVVCATILMISSRNRSVEKSEALPRMVRRM